MLLSLINNRHWILLEISHQKLILKFNNVLSNVGHKINRMLKKSFLIPYLIEDEVESTLISTDKFLVSRRENPLLKGNIRDNWVLMTAIGIKWEDQFMRLKSTILHSINDRILHKFQIRTMVITRKHRKQINRRNTSHQNTTERLSASENH